METEGEQFCVCPPPRAVLRHVSSSCAQSYAHPSEDGWEDEPRASEDGWEDEPRASEDGWEDEPRT